MSETEKHFIFIDKIAPFGIEARTAQAGIFFSPKYKVTLGGIILSGGTANIEFNTRNGVATFLDCDFTPFEIKYESKPYGITYMRDNWTKSIVSVVGIERTSELQTDWLNRWS